MPEHFGFALNDEQYRAVVHPGPSLIVLAGPGSGKTSVIVHRIANLINDRGVEPEAIVALTFTNKAAEEMRRRLADLLQSSAKAERIVACTFHSFGLRLIRQFADLVGWRPEPMIIDEAQQRALMRKTVDESNIGIASYPHDSYAIIPDALRFIGKCRNAAIFPEQAVQYGKEWSNDFASRSDSIDDAEERLAEETRIMQFRDRAELYSRFEKQCLDRGWVTFDDLQTMALRLLRDDERVRAMVRTEFKHVVVDEFQDVNRAQIELLKTLVGPSQNLCVVGDDDQAIYGFRGSVPDGFRHVEEQWTETAVIELSKNYRSSAVIVAAADRIIANCDTRFKPDKTLVAAGKDADCAEPIEAVGYIGTTGAGPMIGRMILNAIDRDEKKWSDFAVLVRTNTDLDRIAISLEALDIPVDLPESSSILSHPVIQDLMSWLRVLADATDDAHVARLLTRPPFLIDVPTIADWQRRHRRLLSDHRERRYEKEHDLVAAQDSAITDDQSDDDPVPPFIEHLAANEPDSDSQRFISTYRGLQQAAGTESAEELVLRIIHDTGMLTLDPVSADAHQHRLEQLGRFLGFVRERMPMIEPPRRVREFLRYVDDLIEAGSALKLGATPEDRMDGSFEFSDEDAVRILTAHKSKGLEFDTVFIPQVNSPWGYPLRGGGRDDNDLLPAGLGQIEEPNCEDEERRLFFVALTRAKRQAILLAMTQQESGKRRSPSLYWKELVEPPVDQDPIPIRVSLAATQDPEDQSEEYPREDSVSTRPSDVETLAQTISAEPQRAIRLRERYRVRQDIYGILHALASPDLSSQEMSDLQNRLIATSMRLPILAARDAGQLRATVDALPAECREELAAYAASIETREPWFRLIPPPAAPLKLSYSDIDLYERCPRCYWLRKVVGLPDRRSKGAAFGSIIHRSLEFFYKKWREADSGAIDAPIPTMEDLLRLGHDSYRDLRDTEEPWSPKMERQIEQALRNYFERLHHPQINPVEIERSIVFDYPQGEHTHRINVRIDRVDFDETGHHVIDYKTGKPTKARMDPKSSDLQLGVYMLALSAFLDEEFPNGSAQYWLVPSGDRGILRFDEIKLPKVRKKIDAAIDGILAGIWEKEPNCRNCELLAGGWSPEFEAEETVSSP